PVDRDDAEREEDLVPKVGDLEHVPHGGDHGWVPSRGVSGGGGRFRGWSTQRLVRALPCAGGRPFPNGGGRISTVPPAEVMASSADFDTAWAFTVTLRVSSPRPRTLMRPFLFARPFDRSDSGVISSTPDSSMVSRLMAWYSTRNGFLKPLSFGTRMCSGIWPPSNPAGMVSRARWPLVPRPAVLPPLPAM